MKKALLIIISMIISLSLSINFDPEVSFFDCFQYNEIYLLLGTVLIYIFLLKKPEKVSKKEKLIVFSVSLLLSLFYVIGFSISRYNSLNPLMISLGCIAKTILKLCSFTYLLYILLVILYKQVLPNLKLENKIKANWLFNNPKKSFFICAGIIFVAYLPLFLHYYPGIFTTDSVAEMKSVLYNIDSLINHHPIVHIYFVALCLKIGSIFNSINLGIAIYSIVQMIACSLTFSYIIQYFIRKKLPLKLIVATFIYFIICPTFSFYSITMWKDIPFALSMVFFSIQIFESITNEKYFSSKMNFIKLLISGLSVILFRNNGIYVVLISFVIFTLINKKSRKYFGIFTVLFLSFYLVYKGPFFSLLNVTDGPSREALSVPLQQIARTVKYRGDELTEEDYKVINKYILAEDIAESYYPLISDNIKDTFNEKEWKNNKGDLIKLWFELLIKHPKVYVESFLIGSVGYWYPGEINSVIPTWYDYKVGEFLGYDKHPIIKISFLDNLAEDMNKREIPYLSMFWNIGFVFWLIVISLGYVVYKSNNKLILGYIPLLVLWLTTTASPVWCEYRYIYAMFLLLPILLFIPIVYSNK